MAVEITWLGHASFRLGGEAVVYIDPWKVTSEPLDGSVVFVSHSHFDHCSPEDVAKVLAPGGAVVGPADAVGQIGGGKPLSAGSSMEAGGVTITGVPAYNVDKDFHPKANGWLGAVVRMDGVRIYYAGDTDRIAEMSELADIDVALLPVGGTYTMTAAQAAQAAGDIGAKAAVPYHFGDIVGSPDDGQAFADAAPCQVHVLWPGGSLTV